MNIYNILNITDASQKENKIDEKLAQKIEQEIIQYEKQTENKIKYIAIKCYPKEQMEYEPRRILKESLKRIRTF